MSITDISEHHFIVEVYHAGQFFERGDTLQHFHSAILRHAADLLVRGSFPDLAFTRGLAHRLFDLAIHENDFHDGDTAFVAEAVAFVAAFW